MITKALILAMILMESGGNPIAQSHAGAEGLLQMTPIAVREVQTQHSMPNPVNLFNPEENITYGILLLEHYIEQCGSVKKALICYNGGYAALLRFRAGGIDALPEETQAYVPRVLGLMRDLDPMFQRELPYDRDPSYIESAVNTVFDNLYGTSSLFGAVL